MGKVNAMASSLERKELSGKILDLKEQSNVTYSQLNSMLERPCATSTLQNQAIYQNGCTQKLFNKIMSAIHRYENNSQQQKLDSLRKEALNEINLIFDKYTQQVKELTSEKAS